ncbi:PilZ domain-containing protein [Desulforhopalus singaporensis]|uniref:PilZ domain-containing protein n=1 Tax=Desulforhopalus singaporensis TaxID=91360 RepID=A0A1H0TYB7_9BACT|nr:PilZ domain-containing protein [Desulforhopalus singaporensis]SDP58924.1 PilZ domain-containing protein [Desulforhopalus singaporensis]
MRKERRAFARVKVDLPATLYIFEGEISYSGAILDLSQGGCYFPLDHDVTIGEQCEVIVTVGEGANAETLHIKGQIVRTDGNGAGIRFFDTSAGESGKLYSLLAKQ